VASWLEVQVNLSMGRAHGAQCLEMSKEWTHVGGRGGGGVDVVGGRGLGRHV